MANEAEESESPATTGSKGKVLLWLVIVVFAISGGVATPILIAQMSSTKDQPDPVPVVDPIVEEEVDFIDFDEVTVNLDEARFSRFLRLSFSLQVGKSQKADIESKVNAKKAVFKNWIQVHLAEKSTDDLRGTFGRNQVRREILDFFNKYLFEDGIERIQDILFNEFYVQ